MLHGSYLRGELFTLFDGGGAGLHAGLTLRVFVLVDLAFPLTVSRVSVWFIGRVLV
jgi:hypothetical protein